MLNRGVMKTPAPIVTPDVVVVWLRCVGSTSRSPPPSTNPFPCAETLRVPGPATVRHKKPTIRQRRGALMHDNAQNVVRTAHDSARNTLTNGSGPSPCSAVNRFAIAFSPIPFTNISNIRTTVETQEAEKVS